MKHTFIVIAFLFITTLNAQTYEVTYERKANIEYQLRKEKNQAVRNRVSKHLAKNTAKFKLISFGEISNYSKLTKKKTDTYNSRSAGNAGSVYKYKEQNQLLKEVSLNGSYFLINDSLPNFNWKETGKLKKILGYSCKQIKATVDGITYNAWYTSEIRINDGPDIFWIKKGLILEIDVKNFIIKAVNINHKNESHNFKTPLKGEEISLKTYTQKVNEYKASLMFNKN